MIDDDDSDRPANPGNPHDAYFKAIFDEPRNAGVVLYERLPAAVSALFASGPPELMPGSFIDEALAPHLSDLLYKVRLKTGEDAFIYTLFEHKSSPDALTPLQLLRYMTRIWTDWSKNHSLSGGSGTLPVIVPLVFYHGQRRWNVPMSFSGLFGDEPAELLSYIPNFPYELVDLGHIPDTDLSRDKRLAAMLTPLKHIFDPALLKILEQADDKLLSLERVDLILWLTYIVMVRTDIGREEVDGIIRRLPPSKREDVMAGLAQEFREEWYRRGKAEGEARMLTRQLERRFGTLPEGVKERIAKAEPDMLETWGDSVLDAPNLDAVFDSGPKD